MGRKAFVYTDEYFQFDYGYNHPLRIERLKLTHDLIKAYGLLDLPDLIIEKTVPAGQLQIETFHRPEYLDMLKRCSRNECASGEALAFGLGPGDNPVFPGVWEWSLLTTGASLQCARLVADGRADTAFNMAGGLHHAMSGRASGFCYINDAVIAIQNLRANGLRVAYVDIDAHHGDGVQTAFYETDDVLTVSMHQHGRTLFPGTGFVYETGRGRGQGYAVNMPLYPGTDDEIFLEVFQDLVPDLISAFKPDVLVTQLGVDTMRADPLTNMSLTNRGFGRAIGLFKETGLPWVALGGGGYNVVNVARAWTLAWAIMNDIDPPDELPESFTSLIRPHGYGEERLRDEPLPKEGARWDEAKQAARQVVESVRRNILPVISGHKSMT